MRAAAVDPRPDSPAALLGAPGAGPGLAARAPAGKTRGLGGPSRTCSGRVLQGQGILLFVHQMWAGSHNYSTEPWAQSFLIGLFKIVRPWPQCLETYTPARSRRASERPTRGSSTRNMTWLRPIRIRSSHSAAAYRTGRAAHSEAPVGRFPAGSEKPAFARARRLRPCARAAVPAPRGTPALARHDAPESGMRMPPVCARGRAFGQPPARRMRPTAWIHRQPAKGHLTRPKLTPNFRMKTAGAFSEAHDAGDMHADPKFRDSRRGPIEASTERWA